MTDKLAEVREKLSLTDEEIFKAIPDYKESLLWWSRTVNRKFGLNKPRPSPQYHAVAKAQLAKAKPIIEKQIVREKNEEINKHEIYWRDAVDKAKREERERICEMVMDMYDGSFPEPYNEAIRRVWQALKGGLK